MVGCRRNRENFRYPEYRCRYAGLINGQHKRQGAPARHWRKKRALGAETNQDIGVSRGGKNTKIHAIVDGLGNPVKLFFTGGNINDNTVATDILSLVEISGSIVMGDKAYGSKEIRDYIAEHGATYAIPPKSNNPDPWDCDWWQYKERHLVECFFNKLKHFRRVATRYDKLISRFKTFVYLAAVMVLLK